MTPVALYVRVSSKRQDYQRQISELELLATKHQFQVVQIFQEVGSATKRKKEERPELLQLIKLAETGAIQKVLVSEISRLGRKTSEILNLIDRFTELKVSVFVKSLNLETLLDDGRKNPAANLVFVILAELASSETEQLGERIRSGLEEARRKNKVIGRPKGSVKTDKKLLEENPKAVRLLKSGKSIREVAKLCEVSNQTVQKIKKALIEKAGK
ncbi:recombinase family protein [Nibribacter ruber]|uniref:Recombinase family protein n=1 Tax=Nibribacter ruber TaxID=2698458 RepID=A0A6P1P1C0_9BACT|nr:recombinase family protein [Nibribacter ruber]QHL87433.1 recombinase family protein [Nibribacter ruber]